MSFIQVFRLSIFENIRHEETHWNKIFHPNQIKSKNNNQNHWFFEWNKKNFYNYFSFRETLTKYLSFFFIGKYEMNLTKQNNRILA
jgi:hypothetical protein